MNPIMTAKRIARGALSKKEFVVARERFGSFGSHWVHFVLTQPPKRLLIFEDGRAFAWDGRERLTAETFVEQVAP